MIVNCPACHGTGEVLCLPRGRYSPEDVMALTCGFCAGTGDVQACGECDELLAYCGCPVSVVLPVPAGGDELPLS
jgi:DnaJ-class molecular chaperone